MSHDDVGEDPNQVIKKAQSLANANAANMENAPEATTFFGTVWRFSHLFAFF